MTTQSEEYFFNQRRKKTTTKTVMASRFWSAGHVVGLFDSHFSWVYLSRLKWATMPYTVIKITLL